MWNPWRHLRDQLAGVTVHTHHRLPAGTMGLARGDIMWLCRDLTQAERRCTLAHEIIHLERGPAPPAGTWWAEREERAVHRAAARRLITLCELVDALLWAEHTDELAEELWVDSATVTALTESLTPAERAWVETEMNRRRAPGA